MKVAKFFFILGGAVLVTVMALWVWLIPQPRSLDLCRELLEGQNFVQARTALGRKLEKDPQWHEARALLTDVELGAQQPLAALAQMIVLRQAKWDTTAQDEMLLEMLTEKSGSDCIDLLQAQTQSVWTREFSVRIALFLKSPELARRTLPLLYEIQRPKSLIAQAWRLISEDDFVEAWKIAAILGSEYEQTLLDKLVHSMTESERNQALPALLALNPNLPQQIIVEADKLGGNQGLDLLASLEKTGWKPAADNYRHYPNVKLSLLVEADLDNVSKEMFKYISWDYTENFFRTLVKDNTQDYDILKAQQLLMAIEAGGFAPDNPKTYAALKLSLLELAYPAKISPSFFTGIRPADLGALAERWVSFATWDEDACPREVSLTLLAYLEQDAKLRGKIWFLKQFLEPPPEPGPARVFYQEQRRDQGQLKFEEVSPEMRHVLYTGWDDKTYWFDLDKQEHIGEFTQALRGVWEDSSLVALIPEDQGEELLIYDTDTGAEIADFAWTDSAVLGWQDGCLLLAQGQVTGFEVEALDPDTKKSSPVKSTPVLPSLSDCGEIGYLTSSEDGLSISVGENEFIYTGSWTQESWELHGWLPGDRGVVLRGETGHSILTFADGKLLPLASEFTPHPQGWLDDYRIAGTISNGLTAVLVLDIRNMSWTNPGISWHQNGRLSGNFAYLFRNANLLIFPLE